MDRRLAVLALLIALIACGTIISYFVWKGQQEGSGLDFSLSPSVVTPGELPPGEVGPASKPAAKPELTGAAKPPPPVKAAPSVKTVQKDKALTTPEFAFQALPHDAPLAEFPHVLAWQKRRDWYKTRDLDMGGNGPPTPPPDGLRGVPKPPPVPPTPPVIPPTPESPSGL